MEGFDWSGAHAYDAYVGRWSVLVATRFVEWLALPAGADWVDLGCGTGALSSAILAAAAPARVRGYDRSEAYVSAARNRVQDSRVSFEVADATALPEPPHQYDAAVSGLMLNFVPDPAQVLAEMKRVVCRGGRVAVYVWDYAEGMELIRIFWDAAVELDPAAAELDEGRCFPICRPEPLAALFESARMDDVQVKSIEVSTRFRDFDDYWTPFLGGQGPAPGYAASLNEQKRAALRERIRSRLRPALDGSIELSARAWAVSGVAHARTP